MNGHHDVEVKASGEPGGMPLPPDPTDQDRGKSEHEIFLELAQMAQQSFDGRRVYEWKAAYGLWTAIGVFTFFAIQNPGIVPPSYSSRLWIAYAAIWLVWTFIWQPAMRTAFDLDKRWKHYYMHRAEKGRPPERSEADPWTSKPEKWCSRYMEKLLQPWVWAQSGVTAVFLVVSMVIVQAAVRPEIPDRKSDNISISGANVDKVLDKLTK